MKGVADEVGHEVAQHPAVVGQVVAAEHRDRAAVLPAAVLEASHELGHDGARAAVREVGGDVGVAEGQAVGGRVVVIALFGHGQRDHAGGRRRDAVQDRAGIGPSPVQLADGADHPQALARAVALGQGVQPVLGGELLHDCGAALADAADPPVTARGRDRVLGVHRLVGAVKRADAEVDDADRQRGRVHARRERAGEGGEGGEVEARGHITAPSCQGRNSSSPNPSSSLLVRRPEAVARISPNSTSPSSETVASPSRTVPPLKSMSSPIRS